MKHKVPCWEAEIENDVLVYDVNWEYQTTLSDPFGINCGFYLPVSQIYKIHNIKKRKSRKASYDALFFCNQNHIYSHIKQRISN